MKTIEKPQSPDFSKLKDIVYSLWEIVKQEMFTELDVEEKYGNELVTRIDKLVETTARQMIKSEFGNVNFLWEEFPDEDNGSDTSFIIDPLDGTESFINREFNTTISIWVEIWWSLVYGIVYDFMKDILYEGNELGKIYMQKKHIELLRKKFSNQTRVLVSGRWQEVTDLEERLKQYPQLRVTRAYWSVALQAVQTWAGNYDGYVRAGKMKKWDIAWATPFIEQMQDTSILARDGSPFDFNNPEDWVIVVRDSFREEFLEIVQ